MKSIKFFKSQNVYAAASFASANSFFFNQEAETSILFRHFDKYLAGMVDLIELKCFPAGWIAVFRTKTEQEIMASYRSIRSKSKVAQATNTLEDVEHILSEHFRIMNSQTVKFCNKLVNRHGSRVHSRFQKMIFEDLDDYKRFKSKLDQIQVFSNQYLANFMPEFGMMVHRSDLEWEDFNWDNHEDKQEVVENFKKFYGYYGRITEKLSEYCKKLRTIYGRCFVSLKSDVLHSLITTTLAHQKHQFPPRFSIFRLI